jgi:hypothetical protein
LAREASQNQPPDRKIWLSSERLQKTEYRAWVVWKSSRNLSLLWDPTRSNVNANPMPLSSVVNLFEPVTEGDNPLEWLPNHQ